MNPYFCVLPFYSYELAEPLGKNIYCCRLRPRTDIELVRESIRNHVRAPDCQSCWKLEDAGLTSERQIHNQTLDYFLDRDIELIEQEALEQGPKTKIVKLATSNICNGTCVTCNSNFSSSWAALERKPITYKVAPRLDLDFGSITQLSFVGGEPLLEKENFQILQELKDLGNTNCFISIVTNGSISLTNQQKDLLQNFSNLNICLSIDGTESVFEYMRYPLKWDQLVSTIKDFRPMAKHLSVSAMISNLNVFYYNDLVDFFELHSLTYLCKQINYPSIFSPGNLPNDIKDKFLQSCTQRQDQIEKFLSIGRFSDHQWQECLKEIARQDNLKKIQIQDYMPTTAKYLFTNTY